MVGLRELVWVCSIGVRVVSMVWGLGECWNRCGSVVISLGCCMLGVMFSSVVSGLGILVGLLSRVSSCMMFWWVLIDLGRVLV